MSTLETKLAAVRSTLLQSFPERAPQIHLLLTALLAGGHVLLDDYEGSGCRDLIFAIDDLIIGEDPDAFTHIDCHAELKVEEVLPLILQGDVVLFEHFNRASLQFQILVGQLLRDRQVLAPDAGTGKVKLYNLPPTIFIAAHVNHYEGGADAIPYEVSNSFLFRVEFDPLADEAGETKRELASIQHAKAPRHTGLMNLSEVAELRAAFETSIEENSEWNGRLIKLANAIKRSPDTIGRSRPSLEALREIKRAWGVAQGLRTIWSAATLFSSGGARDVWKIDADTAFFFMAALGHRFPRTLNSPMTGASIVQQTIEQLDENDDRPQHTEPSEAEGREKARKIQAALEDAYRVYETMRDHLFKSVFGRGEDPETHKAQEEGQEGLGTLNLILAALLGKGHVLLEDYPGTGKTFMVKMLSDMIYDDIVEQGIDIEGFRRIQCVPDLMPGDLTGYEALVGGRMVFRKGPIFAYFLLLDEINRTTPKVQAAMLEAMAESQVTIGDRTYKLGGLFFVMATQNPLDTAGTFPLPAAQLDRFLFKRRLKPVSETAVGQIIFAGDPPKSPRIPVTRIVRAVKAVKDIEVKEEDAIVPYLRLVANIFGDRIKTGELKEGSKPSPRSLQNLLKALKAIALIRSEGKNLGALKVKTEYVREVAGDYFRHRIFPVNEEMTDGERDALIKMVLNEADAEKSVLVPR